MIFAGIFVYLLLELIYNFIFNKDTNKKRIFILFISSIIGLGIGFGISTVEIANTEYIDDSPSRIKDTTFVKEYKMKDNLFIMNYWHNSIQYIVDESLVDTIKIETTYYDDYSEVVINYSEEDGYISINKYDNKNLFHNKILKLILEDLSNKTLYDYANLKNMEVKIYTSSKNIEIIKSNEVKQEHSNQLEYYNNEIIRYQNEMTEKDNKIHELEGKITDLENDVNEYKFKIEEFKNVLE